MNELSSKAKDALRGLRSAHAMPGPRREELWRDIERSIEAGAARPGGRTDRLLEDPDPRRTPRWVWPAAVAAAAVLGVWGARAITAQTAAVDGQRAAPAVAPYEVQPDTAGGRARAATPPPPSATVPRPQPEPIPEDQPAPTSDPLPPEDQPVPVRVEPPRPVRPTPALEPGPALGREMQLMRRAQAALDGHDPTEALRLLEQHGRDFADGQLAEDRRALRIVALCDAEEIERARREASAFRRDYPRSHYQRKIAGCLDKNAPPDDGSP